MEFALTTLFFTLLPRVVVGAPTEKRSQPLLSKFSSLVVFGDSYTDDGVYNYTPPVATQKTNGSTGGRVWPQYIQQYTGINLYNYAHSGDVCDKIVLNVNNHGIKQNQIPSFLADNGWRNSTTGEPALINPAHETVYAMWIGTNDLSNSGFLTEVEPPGLPLTYYTDCVYEQFDRLYEAGGRVFVFMNIAPINLSPQYGLPWAGGLEDPVLWPTKMAYDPNITQTSEKMRQYLTMANSVFEYRTPYEMLIGKRYPGSTFAIYDIHGLVTDIYNNPSLYLNGTAAYNVTSSVYACGTACAADDDIRDSYLWNNDLHPSEQTDRVIAREFVDLVKGQSKWVTYWRS